MVISLSEADFKIFARLQQRHLLEKKEAPSTLKHYRDS